LPPAGPLIAGCSTVEMAREMADKSIFSFSHEVKVHKVDGAHDSLFAPPGHCTPAGAGK
jgi:hypothetical protein